jgi:tether containing UBX domain for GLUT4
VADLYRYNNKPVDLSVSFRLSGLPSGANLELVQASRSPTVISVAVQLPESESNRRIVQKFSSATTLWKILRVIETAEKLNLTERASPSTSEGAGRLYYEMPVLSVMNREMEGTFEELQKTLAQIGVTSGNVLLKLSHKSSGKPLEEAMKEISSFFKEDGDTETSQPAQKPAPVIESTQMEIDEPVSSTAQASSSEPPAESSTPNPAPAAQPSASTIDNTVSSPSKSTTESPQFTVYSPPSTSTPLAATIPFSPSDYVPTVEHAQTHQSRLQTSSRNTKLLSDAELAAKANAKASTLDSVSSVRVRVRFPDLSVLETELVKGKTAASELYSLVQSNLRSQSETFLLRYVDASTGRTLTVPNDAKVDVVKKLGWRGGTLVTFAWDDGASPAVKKAPALNDEMLSVARKMEIPVHETEPAKEGDGSGFFGGMMKDMAKTASKITGQEKEAKLKNLLGFGKKK